MGRCWKLYTKETPGSQHLKHTLERRTQERLQKAKARQNVAARRTLRQSADAKAEVKQEGGASSEAKQV